MRGIPTKQQLAQALVANCLLSVSGVISYHAFQESLKFCLRRAKSKLTMDEATSILQRVLTPLWKVQSSPSLVAAALDLHGRNKFSWYDSLIVAAALEANCHTLYSEDLQDGLQVNSLTIKNPFNPPTT